MTPTKKRGGPQPGSGRPPKAPNDKVVKCKISMTHEHHKATEGDRSGMIRKALDWYLYFKDKPKIPDTTTVTVTTGSEASEPIIFTVKGYED